MSSSTNDDITLLEAMEASPISDDITFIEPKKFLIAGVIGTELSLLQTKIKSLGGSVVDQGINQYVPTCTHVIAPTLKPTEKVLAALAAGKWILSITFVHESHKIGHWVKEEQHEFRSLQYVARFCRRNAKPYKSWKVYILVTDRPMNRSFHRVLTAGGAEVCSKELLLKKSVVPDFGFSDVNCYASVRELVGPSVPIINVTFIKDTLLLKKKHDQWPSYMIHSRVQSPPIQQVCLTDVIHNKRHNYVDQKTTEQPRDIDCIQIDPKPGCDVIEISSSPIKPRPGPGASGEGISSRTKRRTRAMQIPFTQSKYGNIKDFINKKVSNSNVADTIVDLTHTPSTTHCSSIFMPDDGRNRLNNSVVVVVDDEDVNNKSVGDIEILDEYRIKKPKHILANDSSIAKKLYSPNQVTSSHVRPEILPNCPIINKLKIEGGIDNRIKKERVIVDEVKNTFKNVRESFISVCGITVDEDNSIEDDVSILPSLPATPLPLSAFTPKSNNDLIKPIETFVNDEPIINNQIKQVDVTINERFNLSVIDKDKIPETQNILTKTTSVKETEIQKVSEYEVKVKPYYYDKNFPPIVIPPNTTQNNPLEIKVQANEMGLKNVICRHLTKLRRVDQNIFCNTGANTILSNSTELLRFADPDNIQVKIPEVREQTTKQCLLYHSYLAEKYDSTMEEGEEKVIELESIEWLFTGLSHFSLPNSELIGDLLQRFVRPGDSCAVEIKASTMVYRLLALHPPSTSFTRSYYMRVLAAAAPERGSDCLMAWVLIKSLLEEGSKLCQDEKQTWSNISSRLQLLRFVTDVIKEDIKHWNNRRSSIPGLLTYQIFWGSSTNPGALVQRTKQLIKFWVSSHNKHYEFRKCVNQLFEVMLELTWWWCNDHLLLTPGSCNPPSFLRATTDQLLIHLRKLELETCIELATNLMSGRHRLYLGCVIFQLSKGITNSVTFKTLTNLIKDVSQNCCNASKSKSPIKNDINTAQITTENLSKRNHIRLPSTININKRNYKGQSVLLRSCINNDHEKVQKLLTVAQIAVNLPDYNGYTALHEAAMAGYNKCVSSLLSYKPVIQPPNSFLDQVFQRTLTDASTKGPEGRTPLHDAVENKHYETTKLLLQFGGGGLLKNKLETGETPLDLAEDKKMKNLLTSYQGETAEYRKMIHQLQLSTYQQNHLPLIELSNFLLNSYMEAMGLRYMVYYITKHLYKQAKKQVQLGKEREAINRTENIPSNHHEDQRCVNTNNNPNPNEDKLKLIESETSKKFLFPHHSKSNKRISREVVDYLDDIENNANFDKTYTSITTELNNCQQLIDSLPQMKKSCTHLNYIEFTLSI